MTHFFSGWAKASASNPSGSCVEHGTLTWRKASFSASSGNCVEHVTETAKDLAGFAESNHPKVKAAEPGDTMHLVRDSKNPAAVLVFSDAEWKAFLEGVRAGEFG
jgi:Domain of unknown function (DUF397)